MSEHSERVKLASRLGMYPAEPRRVLGACLALIGACTIAAFALVASLGGTADDSQRQVVDVSTVAVEQGDKLLRLCIAWPDLAASINSKDPDLCTQAARVRQRIAEVGAPAPAQAVPAQGVDRAEMVAYVRTAVSDFCGTRAQCAPTADMVTKAVGEYLTAHPPAGVPPTREQIVAAVSVVMAADPDLFRGERGPGPTDDQLSAAVDAFCSAHGGCAGPAGAQGVSVTGLSFECRGGGLVAVETFRDPADGSVDSVDVPVPGASCPTATPSPTETTTSEPTDPPPLLGG